MMADSWRYRAQSWWSLWRSDDAEDRAELEGRLQWLAFSIYEFFHRWGVWALAVAVGGVLTVAVVAAARRWL